MECQNDRGTSQTRMWCSEVAHLPRLHRQHGAITAFSLLLGLAVAYLTNKVSSEWRWSTGLGLGICFVTLAILEGWRTHTQRSSGALRAIKLPARNRQFIGRTAQLDTVRETLLHQRQLTIQAINGIGGVGKTTLALEYGHRYLSEYDIVWWIDAEDPRLIPGHLVALGTALGLRSGSAESVRIRTIQYLANHPRWLLIYDNAVSVAATKDHLPIGRGHVLITSRASGWDEIGNTLSLDAFDRGESVAVLAQAGTISVGQAQEVAAAVGDLPLAVVQARGYLGMNPDVKGYLGRLSSQAANVLEAGAPSSYPGGLAVTVKLALERLQSESPAGFRLIQACSFLAPVELPVLYLSRAQAEQEPLGREHAESEFSGALELLQFLGLASIANGQLKFHRLTQAFVRERLTQPQAEAALERARRILVQSEPGPSELPETWPAWSVITPHVLAVQPETSNDPALRRLARHIAWVMHQKGEFGVSIDLARRFHDGWATISEPFDRDLLWAAGIQARSLSGLHRFEEARAVDEKVFALFHGRHGWKHVDTLAIAINLASDFRRLNDIESAASLDEAILENSRSHLGPEHRNTLIAAHNVATDHRRLGRFREAMLLDQETLRIRTNALGPDHPDTLNSMSSLARDLHFYGHHRQALNLERKVYAGRRRLLGNQHSASLRAAENLRQGYLAAWNILGAGITWLWILRNKPKSQAWPRAGDQ